MPFGLKLSIYFYNQLNLQPRSYIQKKLIIPMFLYVDDRIIEMIRDQRSGNGYQHAAVMNYIVCEILLRFGYCINLEKSVFVPTQWFSRSLSKNKIMEEGNRRIIPAKFGQNPACSLRQMFTQWTSNNSKSSP